jgi:LysR family transcriptional activator of nhaA
MEWLNYHHLLYFWTVARYGSVVRASRELRLAQPTISGQVRQLEGVIGEKLFERVGRGLVLTNVGQTVFRYADQIFSLGQDLMGTLKGRASGRPLRLTVGVANALPKALVQKLLAPAFHIDKPVHLICHEDRAVEDFMSERSSQELDLVLTDRPIGPGTRAHAFNHLLVECGITFMASAKLASRLGRKFPRSLDGAPCLLPGTHAALRRTLDQWFDDRHLHPTLVAEFDDSGLMYTFGEEGQGFFPAPTVFENELQRRYQVQVVGRVPSVQQQFYAISVDHRLHHPAVAAIVKAARAGLYSPPVLDGAAVSANELGDDSKAEAEPAIAPIGRATRERLERSHLFVGGDTDALIDHDQIGKANAARHGLSHRLTGSKHQSLRRVSAKG